MKVFVLKLTLARLNVSWVTLKGRKLKVLLSRILNLGYIGVHSEYVYEKSLYFQKEMQIKDPCASTYIINGEFLCVKNLIWNGYQYKADVISTVGDDLTRPYDADLGRRKDLKSCALKLIEKMRDKGWQWQEEKI